MSDHEARPVRPTHARKRTTVCTPTETIRDKQCSQTGKTPSDAAFTTDDEHGDTPPSQHSGAARANRGADCFHNWPTDTALLTADRRHPCLITPLTCATDTSIRCNAQPGPPFRRKRGGLHGAREGCCVARRWLRQQLVHARSGVLALPLVTSSLDRRLRRAVVLPK